MGGFSKVFDYPVFAISYADGYLVASGGGGGDHYGISNKLEVYTLRSKFKSTELQQKISTSEQEGIIDSLDYHHKHKIWLGSIDDSTIVFSYKPNLGMRIFGKFKTDRIKKDPKQNVCRFGYDSNYFVTGGNECCVRVWKLSDKLIRRVNKFQQVYNLSSDLKKVKPSNPSEESSLDSSQDSSDYEQYESTMRMNSMTVVGGEVLDEIVDDDDDENSLSNIDDTSPSPPSSPSNSSTKSSPNKISPQISPLRTPTKGFSYIDIFESEPEDKNGVNGSKNEDKNKSKKKQTQNDSLKIVNNIESVNKNTKNELCKLVLEHREHNKPINDCCIYNELLVSACNEFMVFYKLLPNPKLLLKHESKSTVVKFVKVLSSSNLNRNEGVENKEYRLMTIEYTKTDKDNKDVEKSSITLWNFNMNSRKLVLVKNISISPFRSSSITLDLNSKRMGIGFGNGSIMVYSLENFKPIKKIHRHMLPVTDLSFVDGDKLLSSGVDYYVFVNNISKGTFKICVMLLLLAITLAVLYKFKY